MSTYSFHSGAIFLRSWLCTKYGTAAMSRTADWQLARHTVSHSCAAAATTASAEGSKRDDPL
jgi:hypothetical protein